LNIAISLQGEVSNRNKVMLVKYAVQQT
jgi:hypothetical protein